jgi:hypothetical protein
MSVGTTTEEELQSILGAGGRRAEIYRALDELRHKYSNLIRSRYPKIPRRVSGYENLDELLPEKGFNVARALVGTEDTCVTVLKATVKLVPSPPWPCSAFPISSSPPMLCRMCSHTGPSGWKPSMISL